MNQIIRHARRKLRFEYQYGILALVNGSLRTPDNAGYYVRPQLSTGEYASPVRLRLAENAVLKPYEGMAVKLIVDQTGQLVISGPNLAAIINQGLNPLTQNPGDSGAWGLINGEQLGPLYCAVHPTTSWAVRVYPGVTQFGSTAISFAGGDLTGMDSDQPASGNHCYIGVFLTPAGALVASASTAQATSSALGITDIQECIDGATRGSIFLRAYVVTGDDAGLTQSTSIDRRSLWSVGAGNFIDLLDVPSAFSDKSSHTLAVSGDEIELVFLDTRRYLAAYNYGNNGTNYRIGIALGVDERNMQIVSEPAVDLGAGGAWDDDEVKDAYIVRGPLGVLYMYYAGNDGTAGVYKIGLARSYDNGLTWTKYDSNPILTAAAGWESTGAASLSFPAVIYDIDESDANKRWKMWYAGGQWGAGGVGYAYSADGLSWTKYASNPVLTKGAGGQWDDTYLTPGPVVKLDNIYYMFYSGNNGSGTWQAGLATFTNPEGTYTQAAGNPLLASDGITTALTASVAIGNTTLAVTNALLFPVGAPVWVYSGTTHYLTHVKSIASSTSIVVEDAAPVAVPSAGGNVRSAAYNSLNINSAIYDGNGWLFGITGHQVVSGDAGLKEVSMIAFSKDLTDVTIDYGAGLLIPITAAESTAASISKENPSLFPLRESEQRNTNTGMPYGSTYGNDIAWAQASAVQNTWYEVADADMVDGQLHLVTHDGNGKLTVSKSGVYYVSYDLVSASSVAGKELQSAISVSGTENNAGIDHEIATNSNAKEKLGSHAILYLAANSTIEVSIRTTDTGTPDIAVEHLNIALFMIGGN